MPDIGVLNIQIHDDSKKAASGLQTLKTRLDNLKSTAEGYDLSNVAGQIKAIVDVAKFDGNAKMGSAIKNLGSFLNSITSLSKVKSLQIDVKPIEELKKAVGEGFNLGAAGTQLKQMHEALNMEWNVANARTARDSMKAIAAGIRELDGANATKTIKGAAEALSEYNKALGEVTIAEKEYNKVLGRYTGEAHPGGMSLNLQQFGGNGGVNWRDQMGIGAATEQIKEVAQKASDARSATIDINQFVEALKQMRITTADGLNLDVIATNLERIKETTAGGIGLTSASTGIQKLNSSAQDALSNGTVGVLNDIANALGNIKSQSEGMNLQNVRISFGGSGRASNRGSNSADSVIESVKETVGAIEQSFGTIGDKNGEIVSGASSMSDSFTEVKTSVTEVVDGITELDQAGANAATTIRSLFSYLEGDVDYSNLRNVVDNVVGINRQTDITKQELEVFVTDASKKIEKLMDYLNNPGKAEKSRLREFIDESLGIGKKFTSEEDAKQLLKYADTLEEAVSRLERVRSRISTIFDTLEKPATFDGGIQAYIDNSLGIGKDNGNINNASALLAHANEILSEERSYDDIKRSANNDIQVFNSLEEAANHLGISVDDAKKRVENFKNAINLGNNVPMFSSIEEGAKYLGISVEEAKRKIEEMRAAAEGTAPSMEKLNDAIGSAPVITDGATQVAQYLDMNEIDLMTMKYNGMADALARDIEEGKLDNAQIADRISRIHSLAEKIEELKNAQEETASVTEKMRTAWGAFKGTLKSMFPTLTSMIKRFGQIAKYRFLRTVLKQITSGAREGLENVYRYSQIVGTSFAPAMDSAASALAQMKNSVGAALAPALQAIIPVLNNIVSAFINVINVANQFFALLNGHSSWTRAVQQTTTAYDDLKKSAKGAGGAAKDLLADWDELNIIQSTGGGGGSGKEIPDYANMFEEVYEFDDTIRNITEFVKDNFAEILGTVVAIKSAILGWKLSKALSDSLPLLSKIATGFAAAATIGISIMLTDLTGKEFTSTGNVAWLIADALTGALGATIAGRLAAKIGGGRAGIVTAGFTLVLCGTTNIVNAVEAAKQEKEAAAWMLGVLGSIQTGIGSALIALGLGAAAGVSVAAGIATAGFTLALTAYLIIDAKRKESYRQMAYDSFRKVGIGGINPAAYLHALQEELDNRTKNAKLVVDIALELDSHGMKLNDAIKSIKVLNRLVTEDGLSKEDAQKFKDAWDIVIEELQAISGVSYETMFAGLDEAIANGTEEIKKTAAEYRKEALRVAGILDGANGRLKTEMKFLENEILSGTATEEDIERYKKIYTRLAQETESGLSTFKTALEKGSVFDFTEGDNPVDEAVKFINSMNADYVQPAIDTVTEQYNSEMKALDAARQQLELYHDLGELNDTQYSDIKAYYDNIENLFARNLENQIKEVTASAQTAMDRIVEQSIAGYLDLDQSDSEQLKSYIDNVFIPIKTAIEAAGGEVPEALNTWIENAGEQFLDVKEMARKFAKSSIYEMYQAQQEAGNIEDAVKLSLAYEVDLVSGDPSKIADEERREIINALYEVFEDPDRIIRELLDSGFGWSLEDIIGSFDFENVDIDDLYDIIGILDELRTAEEDALYMKTQSSRPDERLGYAEYLEKLKAVESTYDSVKKKVQDAIDAKNIRENDISRKTESIAASYEDMAKRIKRAFDYINGLSFDFSLTGLAGKINVNQFTKRASGGPIRSGDLVMANENGNIEMMGRMGNQPVVANNQQIVAGISQGVATANAGVENRLSTIETLLVRLLNKEFVAKAVPSSGWGALNQRSGVEYNKVTG